MHFTANDFFLVAEADDVAASEGDLRENPRKGVFFKQVEVDEHTMEDETQATIAIVARATPVTLPTRLL